jgi:hypothetical protein
MQPFRHTASLFLQQRTDAGQFPFVIHQQNTLVASAKDRSKSAFGRAMTFHDVGKKDVKGCSLPYLAIGVDRPAMRLYNSVHDGQVESGTQPSSFLVK